MDEPRFSIQGEPEQVAQSRYRAAVEAVTPE